MIPFLAAHWKPMLLSAALAAGATWFLKPDPQPAVTLKEEARTAATEQTKTDQTVKAGPVKVTVLEFARPENAKTPSEPEAPQRGTAGQGKLSLGAVLQGDGLPSHGPLLKATVTEQGQTTTATHAETAASQSSERKLDLTVTPQARAGWAVQVGLEDVLHGGEVRVAVRRRLLGPFWAEAAALPRTRAVGVGLSVEW